MAVNKLNGKTFDIVEENISKLKELFPEIVNGDNQVDLEVLQDLFEKNGDEVVDDGEEHYKFTWWGKKEAKKIAKEKITKTLRPSKEDSKNWDDTKNIYIEGDNLEALKILLGSYRNRIKMIYIDPPYNTGSDFIYHDKFEETDREYLENTNQLTEDGYLKENPKADGKYHSNWLNMMYPRLILAKDLLKEDGVLIISIDENELKDLLFICENIFGHNNIDTGIWQKVDNDSGKMKITYRMRIEHEYLIFCYRNKNKSFFNKFIEERNYKNEYTNPDNDPRGPWISAVISNTEYNSNKDSDFFYDIKTPSGKIISRQWRVAEWEMKELIKDNRIYFGKDGNSAPRLKSFINEPKLSTPTTLFYNMGTAKTAGNMIEEIMGDRKIFSYPKPVELMEHLIRIVTDKRYSLNPIKPSKRKIYYPGADFSREIDNTPEIILDFFSGSSTLAHAILKVNSEDNINRQFLMVQIPEEVDKDSKAYKEGYENICEIGKERIRRAGDKIVEESGNNELDIGFKVFKVDESNFIPWNSNLNRENIKQAILSTGNNLVEGRKEIDLIYELLLKLNLDLNSSINEVTLDNDNENKIYVIENGFMFICLDNNINQSLASDLLDLKKELKSDYCQIVLLDAALNDEVSININETLSSEGVSFYTI